MRSVIIWSWSVAGVHWAAWPWRGGLAVGLRRCRAQSTVVSDLQWFGLLTALTLVPRCDRGLDGLAVGGSDLVHPSGFEVSVGISTGSERRSQPALRWSRGSAIQGRARRGACRGAGCLRIVGRGGIWIISAISVRGTPGDPLD